MTSKTYTPYAVISKQQAKERKQDMNDDVDFKMRMVGVEERCKSNTHRLDGLENKVDAKFKDIDKRQDAIYKLATSVEILVRDTQGMKEDMVEIKESQKQIEQEIVTVKSEPAKRKAGLMDDIGLKILMLIIGAVITLAIKGFGL